MNWLFIVLCFVLGLWRSGNVNAENVKLDEIVVTATRTEVPRSQIPGSATVMTEKDIESAQVSNVSDLLRDIPGIDVVQQGGAGKTTSIFIRGGESSHTLVLIDGVRVNSTTTGGFDFADLATDNIERIEIIRGPLSTLYGSDAVGGVIQIFTKRAKASSASVGFEFGSYGTARETISTEVKKDRYDLSLAASRLDTEGFSVFKAGSERDGYQNTSISMRLGKGTASGRMDFTTHLIQGTTELDGCKFDAFFTPYDCDNPAYEQERRLALAGFKFQSQPGPAWEQALSASLTAERLVNRDPDPNGINSQINTDIRTIDWQHNIHTSEGNQLIFGYEWQHKKGVNQGNFSKDLSNHAIYLQEQRGFGKPIQLLAGLRWDENTLYESAFTYRVGLSYLQAESIRWHAQYGTGFRGPSLNDLFWPGAGNPDLKPEKSNGWEVGVEQTLSEGLSISLSYYDNVFKDLIQWIPNPSGEWQPQNRAKTGSNGIETNIAWRPSSILYIDGNYTYNDTEDKESHFYLQRRPLNKYGVTLHLNPTGRGKMEITLAHAGKRVEWEDSDFDGKPDRQLALAAYSRVDLLGSYKIGKTAEIFGRIENLLDKEYEEARGYGVAGFSTYGGLRMTF